MVKLHLRLIGNYITISQIKWHKSNTAMMPLISQAVIPVNSIEITNINKIRENK